MPSPQRQPPTRKRWLSIFAFFVILVFAYGTICFLVERTRQPAPLPDPNLGALRLCMTTVALLAIAASVAWIRVRVDGKIGNDSEPPQLSPLQFMTESIFALSFANACAIYGLTLFFMGASAKEYTFFGFGTLTVDFTLILPRGLQFWRAYENRSNV